MLYGGNEFTLADRLFKSTEREDVKKAKEIIDSYFESNPYLRAAIDKVIDSARNLGYVETIGGYRRHLPDLSLVAGKSAPKPQLDEETKGWKCYSRVDLDWDDTQPASERASNMSCPRNKSCKFVNECKQEFTRKNVEKLKKRAERQAFNVKIQGNSADHTNRGLLNFYERRIELAKKNPEWKKVKVISQIYDAVYLLVPDTLVDELMPHLLDTMENTFPGLAVNHMLEPEPPAQTWAEIH
jgi:DNA polymerase I-like protein with 3'-5' exonuclease and polymerase domains